jgi:hypothetical protein
MNAQLTTWMEESGLEARVVLVYDNMWSPPSQEFCKAFKTQVGLTVPLLYDPTGVTAIYREMSTNKVHETTMITNEEGIIAYKTHKDTKAAVVFNIAAELLAEFGECSSTSVCIPEESCLPTPLGDTKKCAAICDPLESESCADDQICYVYTADAPTGACFPDEIIP